MFGAWKEEKRDSQDSASSVEEECKQARGKALSLLDYMDRTEKGLYERLKKEGFSEPAAADALTYVKASGYIDDMRYAQSYLLSRMHTKSRQQLFLELMKKGVGRHTIEEAWKEAAELETPDERAMIRELILKKLDHDSTPDRIIYQKVCRQLLRKGFQISDIRQVMEELLIHGSLNEM